MAHSDSGGSVTRTTPLFRPSILSVSSEMSPIANGFSTVPADSAQRTSDSVPVVSTMTTQPPDPQPASTVQKAVPSDYVFGSNISSRVVNVATSQGASSGIWTISSDQPSSSVFTALAQAVSSKPIESSSETLADSVSKITEDQKHSALNLSEIDPITGEEDEVPVFRQYCRAYIFDTEKQKWNSLGESQFHLNDVKPEKLAERKRFQARVVVRLSSTKRVIINSPIWSEMPVVLVNSKNVRIGAVSEDGTHIRSYLFNFPSDDLAASLFSSLNVRKEKADGMNLKDSSSVVPGEKRETTGQIDGPSPKRVVTEPTIPNTKASLTNSIDPYPASENPTSVQNHETHTSVNWLTAPQCGDQGSPSHTYDTGNRPEQPTLIGIPVSSVSNSGSTASCSVRDECSQEHKSESIPKAHTIHSTEDVTYHAQVVEHSFKEKHGTSTHSSSDTPGEVKPVEVTQSMDHGLAPHPEDHS